MSIRSTSIFKDPNVAKHLSLLHDKYVIVSADKAPNNIVFVCKSHYIDCLIKELGIDTLVVNPTLTKQEIPDNYRSVLYSFGIYHHPTGFLNYKSVLSKCSTKPLSKLLTCILSAVKTGLQSYCDTSYFRGGVNQMWILKNSTQLFLTLS